VPPIKPEHGENRPALDADRESIRRLFFRRRKRADSHQPLGDNEMAGRADRQELGDAFDQTEQERLPSVHARAERGTTFARRKGFAVASARPRKDGSRRPPRA